VANVSPTPDPFASQTLEAFLYGEFAFAFDFIESYASEI
jgi:hypothetical protein